MSKSKDIESVIVNDMDVQEKERQESWDALLESLGQLSGFKGKRFGEMILTQLASSCHSNKETEDLVYYVIEDMKGICPKDSIEGMLATQMIATHYATMECFSRAAQATTFERRQENLNSANKLTRSFTTQMEALNRHRGKGQQRVTVEHVHVHSGGKAIVGNVAPTKIFNQEGGDEIKN